MTYLPMAAKIGRTKSLRAPLVEKSGILDTQTSKMVLQKLIKKCFIIENFITLHLESLHICIMIFRSNMYIIRIKVLFSVIFYLCNKTASCIQVVQNG